ncbi:MAG TPA: hypothetical protein VF595_16770 [Tepidisphaeraceae bacterium]
MTPSVSTSPPAADSDVSDDLFDESDPLALLALAAAADDLRVPYGLAERTVALCEPEAAD